MIIKGLDYLIFLLHIPKANWTYVLITDYRKSLKLVTFIFTDSRKSLELVTFIVVYHHSTDCTCIFIYTVSRDGDEPAESASGEPVHRFIY